MAKQFVQRKYVASAKSHAHAEFKTIPTAKSNDVVNWVGNKSGNVKGLSPDSKAWRCTHCDKLLGRCRGERMHLRLSRGDEYLVSLPVTATCRGCGTLNEVSAVGTRNANKPTI